MNYKDFLELGKKFGCLEENYDHTISTANGYSEVGCSVAYSLTDYATLKAKPFSDVMWWEAPCINANRDKFIALWEVGSCGVHWKNWCLKAEL